MGIFGVMKGLRATKNDVKVAKLELEKEKIKAENRKKDEADESARLLGIHAKENADFYISPIESLLSETTELVNNINAMKERGVKLLERPKLSKMKDQAMGNLQYLYLAKEYLSLLDKVATGVKMSPKQAAFITKFAPFFDGRKVLEEDYSEYEEDDSLWGEIKEELRDLKEEFVSSKKLKEFSFDELLETYSDRIEELKIPDFKPLFKKFRELVKEEKKPEPTVTAAQPNETITCPTCSFVAPAGSKFCPSCGTPMDQVKFCINCGEKLLAGAKFCAKCGTKVE